MYRIIGGDGNEYGPVTAEQMRQWITENRVNGETRVQGDDGVWKTLREFPEFAEILPPPPVAHLPPVQGLPVDFDGDYRLDIGGCLGSGWRVMRSQFGLALGVGLVFMGIQVALALLGAIPFIGTIFSLLAWVITGPLMGGLVFFYLRMVRGESPSWETCSMASAAPSVSCFWVNWCRHCWPAYHCCQEWSSCSSGSSLSLSARETLPRWPRWRRVCC